MRRTLLNILNGLSNIREQLDRAALSALGVMVATVAIVLLMSIAKGVEQDIRSEVDTLGVNTLIVLPGRFEGNSLFAPSLMGISYLSDADVARVKKVEGVVDASPVSFVGAGIEYGGKKSTTAFIVAADPEWFAMRRSELKSGRFFGAKDDAEPTIVLGDLPATELFGEVDPVGKTVHYRGSDYRVIGVLRQRDNQSSLLSQGSFDNFVYVPYSYIRKTQPSAQINRIFIETDPGREPKQLVSSVEKALGERLEKDNYSVLTQEDLLKLVFKIMSILTWLIIGLTSIALFVGGVGIMVVMLMSVNERTKEIGIRRTVGAMRSDIFSQFLAESVFIAVMGGLVGLSLSYVVSLLLASNTAIKPLITWGVVGLSFAVSVGVGGVFGLIPAIRASRRDPVESLRHE
ncbi:MAG: ABC transporter permease [Fimbriimonadaceae bacterium]|nr:ABC transporter permease [Fimbriimonadaceae bacterium]